MMKINWAHQVLRNPVTRIIIDEKFKLQGVKPSSSGSRNNSEKKSQSRDKSSVKIVKGLSDVGSEQEKDTDLSFEAPTDKTNSRVSTVLNFIKSVAGFVFILGWTAALFLGARQILQVIIPGPSPTPYVITSELIVNYTTLEVLRVL